MVGGTAYSISSGKTMVGATAYDITFSTSTEVSVTITGTGSGSTANGTNVVIDGTKHYAAASGIVVYTGDVIQFNVFGLNVAKPGTVTINGKTVLAVTSSSLGTYTWTVPSGISAVLIALSYDATWVSGTITVTTS